MIKDYSTTECRKNIVEVIDNIDKEIKLEYGKLLKYQEENTIDISIIYSSKDIDIDNYLKVACDISKNLNRIADLKKLKKYVENFISD